MLTKQISVSILLPETYFLLQNNNKHFALLHLWFFFFTFKLRVFEFLFKTHIYFQCALKKNQVSIPTVMKINPESW